MHLLSVINAPRGKICFSLGGYLNIGYFERKMLNDNSVAYFSTLFYIFTLE